MLRLGNGQKIRFGLGRVNIGHRLFTARSQGYHYSSKVRAFPFALSSKEAIIHLGPYASKTCMFKDILGSLGARLFGLGWGFTPIQPTRIQPVYFPAWIVDTELEASAWLALDSDSESDPESEQRVVTAILSNSYIPGFPFEPLSRMSFNSKAIIRGHDPIPFTKDLENQHEEDILLLPFTISPFSLLERTGSLSYRQAAICDHLRFLPPSVKTNFLAAYPVLIPLYLAQYDFEVLDQIYTVNFVMEASSRFGRIICEVVAPLANEYPNVEFTSWRNGGNQPGFVTVDRLMAPLHRDHLAHKLSEWMDNMLGAPGTAKQLKDISHVNLDDLRVREFVKSERRANCSYMAMGADILNLKEILKTFSGDHAITKGKVIQISFDIRPKVEARDLGAGSTQDFVTSLEEKRKAIKPQWWTEWENSSTNKESNS